VLKAQAVPDLPTRPAMPSFCALVWFKRDLRMQDHLPLIAATLAYTGIDMLSPAQN
jgi:hypothetical protein